MKINTLHLLRVTYLAALGLSDGAFAQSCAEWQKNVCDVDYRHCMGCPPIGPHNPPHWTDERCKRECKAQKDNCYREGECASKVGGK